MTSSMRRHRHLRWRGLREIALERESTVRETEASLLQIQVFRTPANQMETLVAAWFAGGTFSK